MSTVPKKTDKLNLSLSPAEGQLTIVLFLHTSIILHFYVFYKQG